MTHQIARKALWLVVLTLAAIVSACASPTAPAARQSIVVQMCGSPNLHANRCAQ